MAQGAFLASLVASLSRNPYRVGEDNHSSLPNVAEAATLGWRTEPLCGFSIYNRTSIYDCASGNEGHLQGVHLSFTNNPSRETSQFKISPPSSVKARSTSCLRPSAHRNAIQPPPPAPQTLAASAPLARARSTNRSICGVVIPGARRLRFG